MTKDIDFELDDQDGVVIIYTGTQVVYMNGHDNLMPAEATSRASNIAWEWAQRTAALVSRLQSQNALRPTARRTRRPSLVQRCR